MVFELLKQADEQSDAGQDLKARALLDRAASFDPTGNSAYIHERLCSLYRKLGNYQRAITEGQTALKYDDKQETAIYLLALCYMDNNQYDPAI